MKQSCCHICPVEVFFPLVLCLCVCVYMSSFGYFLMMDFLSVVVSVYLCNLFAFLRVNTSKFNDADPLECLRVVRVCVCKYASMCACVCVCVRVCVRALRGHQTDFEVEDCAGDKGQISRGTNNFNSLDRDRSEGSLSLCLTTPPVLTPLPLSLFKSLMHKYKQVLDEDCRGSSKCTCYAKTAGPLMRANYFRKQ